MRVLPAVLLAATLSGVHAPSLLAQRRGDQQQAAQHGWIMNYDEGKNLARQSGKPLMVVFRCVP